MHVQRVGTEFYIDLDFKDDVLGLFAVINNRPDSVTKEVYEKGMKIYGWFFEEVKKLGEKYEAEKAIPYHKKKRK